MLRSARMCFQQGLIKNNHNVAFPRWFLHPNNMYTTLEVNGTSDSDSDSDSVNHNTVDRAARHRHSILRSFKRLGHKTFPCASTMRLASTTNTGDPTQSVDMDVDTQSTDNQSPLSNFDAVKLHSWSFSVEQFGSLCVHTSLSIKVTPLNHHDYPSADRAFIHLLLRVRSRDDETKKLLDGLGSDDDHLWRRFVRCDVHYNDVIRVTGDVLREDSVVSKEDADFLWLVEVPMSYDVNVVVTRESSVDIEQLENQTCNVQTEEGDIITKKLKSDKVSLRSMSGDINCLKLLQGNITIATGDHGTITTDRLQGQDVCINTDSGAIVVKDVYARKSEFKSLGGDIHLGNLHGDVTISCEEGNLKIGSIDGSLLADVDKGSASVYLAKHTDVNIACKQGDISIKMSPDVQTGLHLQAAKEIDFPQELAARFSPETAEGRDAVNMKTKRGALNLNGGQGSSLTAVAQRGSITLTAQSWLDSLQLQK